MDDLSDTTGDPQAHIRLLRALIAVIKTAAPSVSNSDTTSNDPVIAENTQQSPSFTVKHPPPHPWSSLSTRLSMSSGSERRSPEDCRTCSRSSSRPTHPEETGAEEDDRDVDLENDELYLPFPPLPDFETLVDIAEENNGDDDLNSDESDGDYIPPNTATSSSSSSSSAMPHPQLQFEVPTLREYCGCAAIGSLLRAPLRVNASAHAYRFCGRCAARSVGPYSGRYRERHRVLMLPRLNRMNWRSGRSTRGIGRGWKAFGDGSYVGWTKDDELDDEDLHEAWIIVSMSFRISHYSASPLFAFPDRPTIHLAGDMGGVGRVGSVDVHDNNVRRVHGAVSMLPDGSVRWSLMSTAPNSTEDEWASEAVQLGGVGSAMGSIGMWTGAQLEDGDPLVCTCARRVLAVATVR